MSLGYSLNEIAAAKRVSDAATDMLAALLQCQEYLQYSLGSTSGVNPYPAMEAAIAKATGSPAPQHGDDRTHASTATNPS